MLPKISLKDKYKLPDKLKVLIIKSKSGGLTAKLVDYPGCITHAQSMGELIENLNDAVLTYFEVPRNEAVMADFVYAPTQPTLRLKIKPKEKPNIFVPVFPTYSHA
ncbi:hypothetical protein A2696_03155 [Candidatus Curtissbacteria bacterium RIFCSPHIGHO2_01_FULL_41_13]|uniref:HicB-like antitoxin of toxin-antitoxin system domain-containing protein n=1 Tax=Candidatus Curtissbacteria bacterium RIFCSPHIGHO2_01_FULL_41_13 TaxID=1797745 RepID=A0A1F5G1D5_9BACT|nr:MAG: hypothetical protein A2696_03155 [Candidatus Curtissbacteria bacterium RIFCSPHIGHO2_01_FULL_41_13]